MKPNEAKRKVEKKPELSKPKNQERCTFMYINTCGYMYFYDMP